MTEVRATSESGGQKGRKPECYSMIPVEPMAEVARVFGYGASKYAPGNFLKGYPFSWTLDALQRHLEAFKRGEDKDPESGLHHLSHLTFHALALMEFQHRNVGTDDRLYKETPCQSGENK